MNPFIDVAHEKGEPKCELDYWAHLVIELCLANTTSFSLTRDYVEVGVDAD